MQKHREKNGIRTIGFQQIYLQIKKFTCAFLIFFLQNHKNECIIKVMKKFIKKGKAFLLRNSVSAFEFDCVHSEVNKTNKNLLQICSFVTALLFFLLSLFSLVFFRSTAFRSFFEYFAAFFVFLFFYFAISFLPEKKIHLVTPLMYGFIISLSLYSIYIGIFNNLHNSDVVFFVFAFAFPLIFVDRFQRIFSVSFFLNLLFCLSSLFFKEFPRSRSDVFYSVIFYFMSMLPNLYLTKIRIREFSLRQIIESERDTDELTGLLNKAALIREAKKNINATKNGILIIMDLDYFKNVNDTYGHFTGDNVLKMVSVVIRQIFRSSDVMGRFGGDEFIVFMANTQRTDIAMQRCNQLLEKLNSTKIFPNDPNNNTTIHASLGFVLYSCENDFDSLFKKADKALYQAKKDGKDRACQYDSSMEE